MKGLAYNGKYFADLGVSCNFPDLASPGAEKNPITIMRSGQPPIHVGTQHGIRTLTFSFLSTSGADVEVTRRTLLSALETGNEQACVFVGQLNDDTEVESLMRVGQWRVGDVNETLVDFYQADPRWYERTDTIMSQIAFSGPVAIPLLNHGGATVAPIIELGYSTQRTTESSTVGWKYRRTQTISAGGNRNWNRVRLTIDLGDTSAWVTAGKALSSGDDLRVRFQGREIYRTLTNWNTKRTFVHFIGTIPAGESATYEIVYGNPDATTPRTLSTRTSHYDTYAADDLHGSSGTATAGAGSTLTDAGKAWDTNEWGGGFIQLVAGTGSGQRRRILSNTGTVLTLVRAWSTNPDNTSVYVLWRSGIAVDGGDASAGSATTMTDASQNWAPDQWKGATWVNDSVGSAPATMTVSSNTATVLTFTGSFTVNPGVGDDYHLERYGILNYNVDKGVTSTPHRGLWRSSHYSSAGGEITFGDRTPGGWLPWLMLDNQDQFAQLRVTDETAGASVANWPYLSARRRVRSDLTMPEKGAADGVCFYDPRALVALDWNYRFENDNGIGAVHVMTQKPDGDDWTIVASDDDTYASITAVTSGTGAAGGWSLSDSEDPVRIYLGMLPAGGPDSEIASTESKNRNAEVRCHTRLMVFLSIDTCGGLSSSIWSIGAEAAIYDLNVTGRLGGGAISSEVAPYHTFAVGGDGHYLHLASGQKLWINPAPTATAPLLGLYDSSDVLVSRVPYAALINRYELNLDGTDTAITDYGLLLPPGNNLITTGEDNTTGWTITNSSGVTASISNETVTLWDGGTTALKVQIDVTPAGAWTITLTRTAGRIAVTPGALYEFGFVRRRTLLTNAITAQMTVTWYKTGAAVSTTDAAQTIGGAMAAADTWYSAGTGRSIHPGSVAETATIEAAVSIVIGGTGSTGGAVYFDPITLGVPNLYLDESEIGVLTANIKWLEAHYA